MSTARTWHKGPPPHVGWWIASVGRDGSVWRWWNGVRWSQAASRLTTRDRLAKIARLPSGRNSDIEWSDYYPENARVPRIAP